MNMREPEQKLTRQSYEELECEMGELGDPALLKLLDSRSVKVGDTAASLLGRRKRGDRIIEAILSGEISAKVGKIRALSILRSMGHSCFRAREAYLSLIHDKSLDVVESALFGLVFLQDESAIEAIRKARDTEAEGSERRERLLVAIDALEQRNPFVFSPNFHDAGDVWGLDKERFASRIS